MIDIYNIEKEIKNTNIVVGDLIEYSNALTKPYIRIGKVIEIALVIDSKRGDDINKLLYYVIPLSNDNFELPTKVLKDNIITIYKQYN